MIKKNKWKLILASVAILLPAVLGVIFRDQLSSQMSGQLGGMLTPGVWLPLILLAFQWLCVVLSAKDTKGGEQNQKVFFVVIWIIPVLSWFSCGVIYATALGKALEVTQYTFLLFGLFFAVIGNYLPKCKQSFTTGIKIKWTLANEENWYATHRFAGKIWTVSGLVLMACTFLPLPVGFCVMFAVILIACVVPTIYSYRYYKKQVAEGKAPEKAEIPMSKNMKIARNVTLTAVGVLLAGAMIFIFVLAGFDIGYTDTSFTVDATGWNDVTVNYADIDAIEYRDSCAVGMRTYGFGDIPVQLGVYTNEEFGSYTRFAYAGCDAAVVLSVDGQILVLNGKDAVSTKAIYDELMARK